MASCTKVFETRCRMKVSNMGRKRKNQLESRGTTPSMAAFFGDVPAESHPAMKARRQEARA